MDRNGNSTKTLNLGWSVTCTNPTRYPNPSLICCWNIWEDSPAKPPSNVFGKMPNVVPNDTRNTKRQQRRQPQMLPPQTRKPTKRRHQQQQLLPMTTIMTMMILHHPPCGRNSMHMAREKSTNVPERYWIYSRLQLIQQQQATVYSCQCWMHL